MYEKHTSTTVGCITHKTYETYQNKVKPDNKSPSYIVTGYGLNKSGWIQLGSVNFCFGHFVAQCDKVVSQHKIYSISLQISQDLSLQQSRLKPGCIKNVYCTLENQLLAAGLARDRYKAGADLMLLK